MKIIEEQLLLNNINKIQSFLTANKTMRSIFGKIEKLENKSLQEVSLKSDIEFFDEISFILSVITSIITHPQITTKGEDIIIRADQAHTIQNESYQKLIQDDKLWNSGTESEPIKTENDPCPDGWRVPTSVELETLKSLNKESIGSLIGQ